MPNPTSSAEEEARGIVEQWLSAGCGCGFPPSQLDDAYGQGTHKADLVDAIATALTKRDAEIAEYAAHEEQTHRILGGILGTDDSLERCAKRMRERAEAAERSVAYWRESCGRQADIAREQFAKAEAAEAERDALRAVVEAAREVADSPAEFDDERIGYVVLQVNHIDLSDLRQALGALDI